MFRWPSEAPSCSWQLKWAGSQGVLSSTRVLHPWLARLWSRNCGSAILMNVLSSRRFYPVSIRRNTNASADRVNTPSFGLERLSSTWCRFPIARRVRDLAVRVGRIIAESFNFAFCRSLWSTFGSLSMISCCCLISHQSQHLFPVFILSGWFLFFYSVF